MSQQSEPRHQMKYIDLMVIIVLAIIFFNRNANNKAAAAENVKKGLAFFAENKSVEGVVETSSGLQYQVLHKGESTEQPTANSNVKVHYHGTLIDGTVFDSSVERGSPISFGLNQVIPGWTEGVQLMSVGDKYRFFIQANLGYGDRATGKIKPGSLLIFDVELIAIN